MTLVSPTFSRSWIAAACFSSFVLIRTVQFQSFRTSATEPACSFMALPRVKGEMEERLEPSAAERIKYLSLPLEADELRAFFTLLPQSDESDSSKDGLLPSPGRLIRFRFLVSSIMSELSRVRAFPPPRDPSTGGLGNYTMTFARCVKGGLMSDY